MVWRASPANKYRSGGPPRPQKGKKMSTSLTKKGLVAVNDKIIYAARPAIDLVKLFITDFTPAPAKRYEKVLVNVMKGQAVDFAKGTENYTTGTVGKINHAYLELQADKLVKFTFDDMDFLEDEFAPSWGNLGPASGANLGDEFVKHVMSKLTYAKVDDNGQKVLAASVDAATLADFVGLWAKCNAAGYNPAQTVIVLEPVTYLKLKTLADFKTTGVSMVDIARSLGAILGFKAVIVGPNVSKASGAAVSGVTPTKGVGFMVPENALGIINRAKKAAKEGGELLEYGETVDEETGIVLTTRVVANAADGEYTWSTECLYGADLTKQTLTIGEEQVPNNAPGFLQIVTE